MAGVRETPIGAAVRAAKLAGRQGAESGGAKAAFRPGADDVARRASIISGGQTRRAKLFG